LNNAHYENCSTNFLKLKKNFLDRSRKNESTRFFGRNFASKRTWKKEKEVFKTRLGMACEDGNKDED